MRLLVEPGGDVPGPAQVAGARSPASTAERRGNVRSGRHSPERRWLFGRLNRYVGQQVRASTPLVRPTAKDISLTTYDLSTRGNDQNVERFQEVNLATAAIRGDPAQPASRVCRKLLHHAADRRRVHRGARLGAGRARRRKPSNARGARRANDGDAEPDDAAALSAAKCAGRGPGQGLGDRSGGVGRSCCGTWRRPIRTGRGKRRRHRGGSDVRWRIWCSAPAHLEAGPAARVVPAGRRNERQQRACGR